MACEAVEHGHPDVDQRHVDAGVGAYASRNCWPSSTATATSMSGWAAIIIANPSRTISWSSTTATRTVELTVAPPGS